MTFAHQLFIFSFLVSSFLFLIFRAIILTIQPEPDNPGTRNSSQIRPDSVKSRNESQQEGGASPKTSRARSSFSLVGLASMSVESYLSLMAYVPPSHTLIRSLRMLIFHSFFLSFLGLDGSVIGSSLAFRRTLYQGKKERMCTYLYVDIPGVYLNHKPH